MSLTDAEKNRLKKVGLSGLNKVKRTPKHPSKKAVVAVRDGEKMKIIRFGDPNMRIKKSIPAGRKSFRARHKCSTAKSKLTARYWSCQN